MRHLIVAASLAAALASSALGGSSRQQRQDRRAQRFLRPVRRSGRQGLVHRRANGRRGFCQGIERPQGRDHLRRSPEQARCRFRHRAALGRSGECRGHRRPAEFRRGARRQHGHEGEEPHHAGVGFGDLRPHRKILPADHGAMGARHLGARQRHGQRHHRARRKVLVLRQLRLRARQGAAARHDRGDPEAGRQGAGRGHASARHDRFQLVSAAGAGLRRRRDRARRHRRGRHQRHQADRRIQYPRAATRSSPLCSCRSSTSMRSG